MKYLKLGLILTAVSLFIFACSQTTTTNSNVANNSLVAVNSANNSNTNAATPAAANDELASARKIYSETCVKCHKEDGTGGIKEIEGRKIKAPNFHSERMMNDKDEDWIETIENGAKEDGMPAFKGKISEEDIKNLVKFIHRDIQKKQ